MSLGQDFRPTFHSFLPGVLYVLGEPLALSGSCSKSLVKCHVGCRAVSTMDLAPGLETSFQEYFRENWVWDDTSKPPEVKLSSDLEAAYFYTDPVIQSTGTVAVRGSKGFTEGEHYWEIVFLEPPVGSSVMLGVGTSKSGLRSNLYQYVNLIGQDQESWGLSYKGQIWHDGISKDYCQPFFEKTTIIGVLLDLYKGTLTFYKNGVSLGQAFSGLGAMQEALYPLISSTATETELGLGVRTCRYLSLQEKCFSMIRHSLNHLDSVDNLPLPHLLKKHLQEL